MNELLNYLNNYAKNRKNKQRVSAIMVCLAIIVSFTVSVGLIEPAESASGELICGMEEHEHTQDCFELICGFDEETEEEIVVETTLSDSEETMESTTSTEETTTADTEPATTETATTDTETTETIISTCTDESVPVSVHVHSDECYRLICVTEAHLHKQDCYNQPAETEPAATETSTSTSTETDTTATTEQTAETTTTTTELPEEIYELNPDTFGELYKDRVNILADSPVYIDEYKFYYVNGVLNAHEIFSYPTGATTDPNNGSIKRMYNGISYAKAYDMNGTDNTDNVQKNVAIKAPANGTWILLFGDVTGSQTFEVTVSSTSGSVVKSFKAGDDGIMVVPVTKDVTYTAKQTKTDNNGKARLVYAEFVPTVEPKNGGNYRIRNVKTGLYIEMGDIVGDKQYIQQGGNTPSDDKRNDFKLNSTRDNYYQILPQRDTSKAVDYSKNDNILGTYTKRDYATLTENEKNKILNQEFKFIENEVNGVGNGTYKIYTRYDTDGNSSDNAYCWEISENGTIVNATINTTNLSQDFIFVEKVVTIDTNRTYAIQNSGSKKFLSYGDADITQVDSGEYSESDNNLKFKFEDAGDGYYYIKVLAKGIETNYLEAFYTAPNNRDLKVAAKDESNNNQKFKIIDNLDGTYKIRCEGGVLDAGSNVNTYREQNNQNQKFIILETEPPTVGSPAVISPDTTFLIRNVRSRLYIHREENAPVYKKNSDGDIAYDDKNKPIVESYLTNQAIQHEDKDYIEEETKFKFVPTGKQGEYYIKSVNGDVALCMDNIVNGAANIKYADFNENDDNQKFRAEILDNGSYCFYRIVDGVRYYVGIPYTSVMDGMIIDARPSENVSDNLTFFLVPFVENPNVEENSTRVEARVIFADYNDGKFDLYKYADDKVKKGEKKAGDVKTDERNLYDEPAYRPVLELNGNTTVNANYVVDVSDARKDWCYQYNYVWDLASGTTNTVKLNGVNSENKITLNGKVFNVYYLKDTELGHPGNNGESNAPAEAYKQIPYSLKGDQIIYIFLDPVVEKWWPNGKKPDTFDLSMKKRWDGYNEGYGFRNRPKEKIKIQLQHLVNGKWEKFDSNEYMNEYYYEVTDDKGNRHMVNIDKIDTKFVYYKKGEYYTDENCTTKWNKVTYDDLKGTADALDPQKEKRLIVKMVSSEDWNDIVLTVGGENNPQHFTNGYYYNWKGLPYGNYRVVETQSFYDANDNNVLDAGDRDTSQEYYYMSYPPMRDSRGVLHIQNFTKDMVLDIQKKWYDDTGTVEARNPGKTVKVNIYRSLEKIDDPKKSDFNDGAIYSDVEVTNDNIILKTTAGYEKLKLKDEYDQKYYYYIQEVSVDGYLLKNGNDDGFVKNVNGNFYVDYEDGDGRKFIIENKAKIGIKLNKEWYDTENDANNNTNKMTFAEGNEPNAEFEIYKSDRLGTPLYSDGEFKVNYHYYDTEKVLHKDGIKALTRIADAKIDKNGQFEIYSGEVNGGDGTSKVMSNQLHIYGTEEIFNGITTFKGTSTDTGVFEPQKVWEKTNDYYVLPKGDNNRLYVKPRLGFGGVIEFTFTSIGKDDKIAWRANNNDFEIVLSDHEKYQSGKDLTIRFDMENYDDKCIRRIEGEPKLKSAVFYPYNYYYIREKNSDNCKLIGDDGNGFVVLQDTNTYYLNLSTNSDATRYPIITAKNVPKVNLDITKEWTQSNANISKAMNFEIYKAFANGEPVADDKGYKVTVNNSDYQLTKIDAYYQTDSKGVLTVENLPAFEEKDESYHKLYYYVREVDGNYTITNTNAKNGFIPYESVKYGTAFDDTSSNSGKYNFVNKPKFEITVEKTWLDEKGNEDINKAKTEIKFELYRKIGNGTSELIKDGENNFFITEKHKKLIQNLDAYDSSGNKYTYYIKEIDGETYFLSGFNVKYNNKTNPEECAFSWNKDGEKPVINITNQAKTQNYELPETGGSGTHGCTAAGGTIVLLSAAALLLKRRKKMV